MTQGILASLIASVVFFIAGVGWSRARREWRLRIYRAVWEPLMHRQHVTVVVSTRPGPHPRSTPRVSLNEMSAFVEISETLKSLGCAVEAVDSNRRLEDLSRRDLVLLGGPAANDVTAEVWRRIESRLPFTFDLATQSLSVSGRSYVPQQHNDGRLTKDYALLIRVSDPLAAGYRVLLCCGCHGYGTWGAATAATDSVFLSGISKRISKEKEFCALLEMDIQQGSVSPPHLRELFILA
jgi:hypothetical protein